MSKKLIIPPIGIIICHPLTFFKEFKEEKYLAAFEKMNSDKPKLWHRVMKNVPTQEFLYIYTAYHGKIQHRTNLVEIFRNRDMKFPRPEGGVRSFKNANGITLGPPFVKCPIEIPFTGCQGFKYVTKELW